MMLLFSKGKCIRCVIFIILQDYGYQVSSSIGNECFNKLKKWIEKFDRLFKISFKIESDLKEDYR
jgi:hypothetical protein